MGGGEIRGTGWVPVSLIFLFLSFPFSPASNEQEKRESQAAGNAWNRGIYYQLWFFFFFKEKQKNKKQKTRGGENTRTNRSRLGSEISVVIITVMIIIIIVISY